MRRKLFGEFLVEKGYITREQLDEALSNQIVFGGRLGTNLIEMGFITERKLAQALSEYHKLPAPRLEDLKKINRKALPLVDRRLIERTEILPLYEEGRTIFVALTNPSNIKAIEEFEFKTGKRIKPFVVPEVTFMLLKEKIYGIPRDSRFITLSPHETRRVYEERIQERKKRYEESEKYSSPSPSSEPQPEDGIQVPPEMEEKWKREEEILLEDEVKEEGIDSGLVDYFLKSCEWKEGEGKEEVEIELVDEVGKEYRPLTLEEAEILLQTAQSRYEIAQGVISYALNFFKRIVLFAVKKGFIFGLDSAAPQEVRARVRTAVFPVEGNSTFSLVVKTKSYYLGPLFKSPVDDLFLEIMGGKRPETSFLIPMLFREKVVNILYGDGGPGEFSPSNVSELIIFLQRVSRAYEEALLRRKKMYRELK